MNTPFDHIKGRITVNGRTYSAKEVIRGLLEQGISITESAEGMKIGFKQFTPLTSSSQEFAQVNESSNCPFLPYMNQVTVSRSFAFFFSMYTSWQPRWKSRRLW